MVRKSLRNQSWKCHFCQNLGGSPANGTGNWNGFEKKKKKILIEKVERMAMKNFFFCKNIEKLRSNPYSLLMTFCKIGKKPRIMLKKVWYFSRAKNKVICIEKWSEFSFWISRSPSKFQKLVRNSDSIKRISKLSSQIKVIKASSAQARLLVITSG